MARKEKPGRLRPGQAEQWLTIAVAQIEKTIRQRIPTNDRDDVTQQALLVFCRRVMLGNVRARITKSGKHISAEESANAQAYGSAREAIESYWHNRNRIGTMVELTYDSIPSTDDALAIALIDYADECLSASCDFD